MHEIPNNQQGKERLKSTESEKRVDDGGETETSDIGRDNDGAGRSLERRVELRDELHVDYFRRVFSSAVHYRL